MNFEIINYMDEDEKNEALKLYFEMKNISKEAYLIEKLKIKILAKDLEIECLKKLNSPNDGSLDELKFIDLSSSHFISNESEMEINQLKTEIESLKIENENLKNQNQSFSKDVEQLQNEYNKVLDENKMLTIDLNQKLRMNVDELQK